MFGVRYYQSCHNITTHAIKSLPWCSITAFYGAAALLNTTVLMTGLWSHQHHLHHRLIKGGCIRPDMSVARIFKRCRLSQQGLPKSTRQASQVLESVFYLHSPEVLANYP